MGVQGLTTLLEKHRRIYRDRRLSHSWLLIDGSNLCHWLYVKSGLDQNHGGEYTAFAALIERFWNCGIKALRDCQITPYIVLDGGSDILEKKNETVMQRTVDRIKQVHRAAQGGQRGQRENIMPTLVKLVFRQTLRRLDVQVAQCYGEADPEIATLAREWQCPVLSGDSDFYICDLPEGLLPLSHFQWEMVERRGSNSYIPCKSYNTSSFCIFYQIQRQLLPAFAALAGNDYVKLHRLQAGVSWNQFAPAGGGNTGHLDGLLCWLQNFQKPQEAFEAALGLMGELSGNKKAEVMKGLNLGMEEYQLPPSALKKFFIHGIAPPFSTEVAGVPDWSRLPLIQAWLPAEFLDVLLLQRMRFSVFVDLAAAPSAHLTARPLRQAEASLCLQVLLEALGVPEASLAPVPPALRLPVCVTCFWLQRAQPPADEEVLKALLLGLSSGDAFRGALPPPRQKLDMQVSHSLNQWQSCLKSSLQLNQLLGRPLLLPEPPLSRLFEGTLVHQLVHRMRYGGKKRPFLKEDPCSVMLFEAIQAVVHQIPPQESHRTGEDRQRQPLDDLTSTNEDEEEDDDDEDDDEDEEDDDDDDDDDDDSSGWVQEDLRLSELLSVKTRFRAKHRKNRSKNPELARKEERRGRDLL
ncbi:protein asteroid homolog 1-like [Trematomus bernacchii]|uniref:protein asteroid homolog 1-like n=1 Tax=Trematomus bernacchii TaxID=40690 RepID=UPI001469F304|nr:protein asteroid homolog 1-like [Trematomus bernacchii]